LAAFGTWVKLGGHDVGIGLFDELIEATADAAARVAVSNFLLQHVPNRFSELLQLFRFDMPDILFGEALGVGAFKEPSGGAPMCVGGVAHRVEWAELGGEMGAPELFVEVRIATRFAADGAGGTADVAGGAFEAAAGRDERGDFAEFDVVESAGAAGAGRIGRDGLVHGRFPILDSGIWVGVHVYIFSTIRCITSAGLKSTKKLGMLGGRKLWEEMGRNISPPAFIASCGGADQVRAWAT
jgi:hypothetical protein